MDYAEQEKFLKHSRRWGIALVLFLAGIAAMCLRADGPVSAATMAAIALTAAMAASLCYSPDYLHLTVNLEKRRNWVIRIHWRLIAAALMAGLLSVRTWRGVIIVFVSAGWLAGANLLARAAVPRSSVAAYFWATDFFLVAILLFAARTDLLLTAALLAAAAHLSIVACEKRPIEWAALVSAVSALLLLMAGTGHADPQLLASCTGLVLVVAMGTAWLVRRAQQQNGRNIAAAMRELMDFTGYPAERIRELWATSNQQLAAHWQSASLAVDDSARLAQWYRENSEAYLFAISGYNLEYKRILSNLGVLKLARGACLDYGAGNGELVLELARRGHAATYYDVDGKTLEFARTRAQQQRLAVAIRCDKQDLAAAAQKSGFDTVFSFDVLEHLPDLRGELEFLASLLNPGGLFVFDVPAGSTKAHPMHLNHDLDVRAYLRGKGLDEQRNLLGRVRFRKEEKYAFRRKN